MRTVTKHRAFFKECINFLYFLIVVISLNYILSVAVYFLNTILSITNSVV